MAARTTAPNSGGRGESPATRAIHGGGATAFDAAPLAVPVYQTTTYAQRELGGTVDFAYSRVANPTVAALERALAALEGAPHALGFASGMAATATLAVSELAAGDHVVCADVVYGGTARLLDRFLSRLGVATTYVDATEAENVRAALRPETKLVVVESPGNPTLALVDLAAVARALRGHPALLVVDNTFLTAAVQRPLELGADVVLYSTTKFVEGHNAAVGGAIVVADPTLAERLGFARKSWGTIQAPWPAWLTLQGLKTLGLRMARHAESALGIGRWLERRPEIVRVLHPWLESFPQRELARRQQASGGGLVVFELDGGLEAARAFVGALRRVTPAENLGAVETLITHPATMTHADLGPEERARRGIGDGLLRLSVGLEDPEDLIADLERGCAALGAVGAGAER